MPQMQSTPSTCPHRAQPAPIFCTVTSLPISAASFSAHIPADPFPLNSSLPSTITVASNTGTANIVVISLVNSSNLRKDGSSSPDVAYRSRLRAISDALMSDPACSDNDDPPIAASTICASLAHARNPQARGPVTSTSSRPITEHESSPCWSRTSRSQRGGRRRPLFILKPPLHSACNAPA
jgi:hypothetical protein